MENKTENIDSPSAVIWFLDNGGTVSNETARAMAEEIKMWRGMRNELMKSGCGYTECGMAACGFSDCDDEVSEEVL
jgi:hypothetical protein